MSMKGAVAVGCMRTHHAPITALAPRELPVPPVALCHVRHSKMVSQVWVHHVAHRLPMLRMGEQAIHKTAGNT